MSGLSAITYLVRRYATGRNIVTDEIKIVSRTYLGFRLITILPNSGRKLASGSMRVPQNRRYEVVHIVGPTIADTANTKVRGPIKGPRKSGSIAKIPIVKDVPI